MNCSVCGNLLFAGRAVFRCSCGAITHAHCWEKHIIDAHKPEYVIGNITIEGKFVSKESEIIQDETSLVEEELVQE